MRIPRTKSRVPKPKPIGFEKSASAEPQPVTYRRRAQTVSETVTVAAVIDCRGLAHNVSQRHDIIGTLVAQRRARPDALSIGLDVTPECRVVRADGAW